MQTTVGLQPGLFAHRIQPWMQRLIALALAVATLLGFVVLPPKVSVESPYEGVDEYRPFELPFTLSNDGYFPVYRVNVGCNPKDLYWTFPPGTPKGKEASANIDLTSQTFEQIPELKAGERRSFVCEVFHFVGDINTSTTAIVGCNVAVKVTFRPIAFIHWRLLRPFEFAASISSTGVLHWHYPFLKQKNTTYSPMGVAIKPK